MEKEELQEIVERYRQIIRQKNATIEALCGAIKRVHMYYDSAENSGRMQPRNLIPTYCTTAQQAETVVKRRRIDVATSGRRASYDNIFTIQDMYEYPPFNDGRVTPEGAGTCMLCRFPLDESMHGSFDPKKYRLECGHVFHLLCLYETVQRRECRKECGECWSGITEDDQEAILHDAKREKRDIHKCSQDLAAEMRELDATAKGNAGLK